MLILDANVLVLLIVVLASRTCIRQHKRLSAYTTGDFDLLAEVVNSAARVVISPNTVTEASNLASNIQEPARTQILTVLRELLAVTIEVYVESKRASTHSAFLRLGMTDAVLLNIASAETTLLTADLDLYLQASRQGQSVINFNHHIEANRA